MTIRTVVTYPAPVLRQEAAPVAPSEFGPALVRLAEDMAETMYAQNGIGLAAPQIAVGKRLLVMDVEWPDRDDSTLYALVNPKLVATRGARVYEEGCLSFPGLMVPIDRHDEVVVEALDPLGKAVRIEAGGLLSICIQHEMDHLDGLTLVDRAKGPHRKRLIMEMKRQPWFHPELLPADLAL